MGKIHQEQKEQIQQKGASAVGAVLGSRGGRREMGEPKGKESNCKWWVWRGCPDVCVWAEHCPTAL